VQHLDLATFEYARRADINQLSPAPRAWAFEASVRWIWDQIGNVVSELDQAAAIVTAEQLVEILRDVPLRVEMSHARRAEIMRAKARSAAETASGNPPISDVAMTAARKPSMPYFSDRR
jgi:hypothetical protein